MGRRLLLCGDDDVLDAIAELSRHLDYFEVARLEDLPTRLFDRDDHVVIAMEDEGTALAALGQAIERGQPGFASVVPQIPGAPAGARAIVVAAELVMTLYASDGAG